ncbi:MAG TPA: HAMP domain-containing sensor histidine kinase, partial [Candidatus Acidoferrales bacterium]|nr:HAMP domain-containing sensor histidine kinase [Candidatus Acidoferrales bacterium]
WEQYPRRFADWKKTSADPHLVAGLYILHFDRARTERAFQLNDSSQHFEPIAWPANFGQLREEIRQAGSAPASVATSASAESTDSAESINRNIFGSSFFQDGPLAGWQFEPRIPALVRSITRERSFLPARDASATNGDDWIVIALDQDDVRNSVLPSLSQRYFRGTDGLDYQIAVTAGNEPGDVLYSSDAGFGDKEINDADGTLNIFARLLSSAHKSPIQVFHTPSQAAGPAGSVAITWFPLLHDDGTDHDWRLIVRHRRGGALGAFVADSRRRDLAISFGVLFLLVISMAILLFTSARAQRMAKLQMDFVTAVSHELRTPLTVISSAAENIAHGVVEGKVQLEQYGSVIGAQARKLFEMVEQILLFAAIREGQQRYSMRPLEVTEILDAAISSTAGLIRTAGFELERKVEPDLPRIAGDLPALSQCVQNLITNALKYGKEQKWIGIQVQLSEHGVTGREIQISVSDRGIGIAPEELQQVFEPFYRSPSVMAAQIHGTGLGLPLAKSLVESMKGQITVRSAPGKGSTFTLHLPSLAAPSQQVERKTVESASV